MIPALQSILGIEASVISIYWCLFI